jgi:tetratricopeptide (TPR) repeat protein
VFGADHQGGYLIWKDFPRFRPYLDTRLILRTAGEFAEFLRALDQPGTFDAFQARHRFDYAVLPTSFPDRYLPLAQHLAASPDWTLLFTDGSEALFGFRVTDPPVDLARPETTRAILAGLDGRYQGRVRVAARLNLARLDLVLGHAAQAEAIAGELDDPAARALLARCKLVSGDLVGAEALARQRLASDRHDVGSLNLLALVAIARGDSPAALGFVRQALEVDPYDGEALALLARLEGK